ncbi:MAG TPA: hypothetical protein VGM51_07095, partial [Armatimonadota bacterium]
YFFFSMETSQARTSLSTFYVALEPGIHGNQNIQNTRVVTQPDFLISPFPHFPISSSPRLPPAARLY